MGGDIHRLPILLELLLLRRFAKNLTNYWKVLQTKFLLNKVANAKQTCPRFLLPMSAIVVQISKNWRAGHRTKASIKGFLL